MKISEELAEILGFLCAEGCYVNTKSTYWQYYKNRNKKYLIKNKPQRRIEFGNTNKILLDYFKKLLEIEFDYSPNIGKDRIRICKGAIVDSIISHTDIGHLKWHVPSKVRKGSQKVKKVFIRGFFEGDGTISNRIRFFSTNLKGLEQISEMLTELKIQNKLNGPSIKVNRKPLYEIYIYQSMRETFLNKIKPLTKRPEHARVSLN
ncbi:hypothetical protein HOC80_00780 [archaeon]|jgi:intein/homing endonuclease|nr:hypothetical protein [archaeon]MBT4416619.1 hypothetical protein [archaeon]